MLPRSTSLPISRLGQDEPDDSQSPKFDLETIRRDAHWHLQQGLQNTSLLAHITDSVRLFVEPLMLWRALIELSDKLCVVMNEHVQSGTDDTNPRGLDVMILLPTDELHDLAAFSSLEIENQARVNAYAQALEAVLYVMQYSGSLLLSIHDATDESKLRAGNRLGTLLARKSFVYRSGQLVATMDLHAATCALQVQSQTANHPCLHPPESGVTTCSFIGKGASATVSSQAPLEFRFGVAEGYAPNAEARMFWIDDTRMLEYNPAGEEYVSQSIPQSERYAQIVNSLFGCPEWPTGEDNVINQFVGNIFRQVTVNWSVTGKSDDKPAVLVTVYQGLCIRDPAAQSSTAYSETMTFKVPGEGAIDQVLFLVLLQTHSLLEVPESARWDWVDDLIPYLHPEQLYRAWIVEHEILTDGNRVLHIQVGGGHAVREDDRRKFVVNHSRKFALPGAPNAMCGVVSETTVLDVESRLGMVVETDVAVRLDDPDDASVASNKAVIATKDMVDWTYSPGEAVNWVTQLTPPNRPDGSSRQFAAVFGFVGDTLMLQRITVTTKSPKENCVDGSDLRGAGTNDDVRWEWDTWEGQNNPSILISTL